MIPAIHAALSGVFGFSKSIEVSAHNVANINTDGFKKSRMELIALESGGVQPIVRKDKSSGAVSLSSRGYDPTQLELSNVDLGEETVNRIIGQRGFEANLQTIRTADDMLGSLLDIRK
jgi:flagellar hook protein FlgE